MTAAPAFLEISVPATDVLASLQWYLQLGFQELPVGDTRDYHYAVVTDGRVCIGLHGTQSTNIGLSFVLPNVASHARALMEQGIEPEHVRLGIEEFHEIVLHDPDGQAAALLKARTFSQLPLEDNTRPLIGRLSHLSLACSNAEQSLSFWQDFGFTGVSSEERSCVELNSQHIRIELHEGERRPLMYFLPESFEQCLNELDRLSEPRRNFRGGCLITSPEGTGLLLASAH